MYRSFSAAASTSTALALPYTTACSKPRAGKCSSLRPVRRCKREYQRRTQYTIRRHLMITQSCLLHETKALRDSGTAYVPLITANFYTVGCQRGKGIFRQGMHRLCNIPVTSGRSPQPVANLEAACFPVVGMQSAASNIAIGRALPDTHQHIPAQQPPGQLVDDPVLALLDRLVCIGERKPRAQVLARLAYSLEERLRVALPVRPYHHAFTVQFFE